MKRLYKTWLGIPIWAITGTSIFIILSVIYDGIVGDRTLSRWILLGASGFILLMTIILHGISLKTIKRVTQRQLGG
jgi:drug/metabolite transporter superfamily protein YnfA